MENEKTSLTLISLEISKSIDNGIRTIVEELFLEYIELFDYARSNNIYLGSYNWYLSSASDNILFTSVIIYGLMLQIQIEELLDLPLDKIHYKVEGEFDLKDFTKSFNKRLIKSNKFLDSDDFRKLSSHQQTQLINLNRSMHAISKYL